MDYSEILKLKEEKILSSNTLIENLNKVKLEEFLLSSGSKSIDSVLQGGFRSGTVYVVFGGNSTGKTQLCHQLCVQLFKHSLNEQSKRPMKQNLNIFYLDCENSFRPERLKEFSRDLNHEFQEVLSIITQKADVFFEDLVDITKKSRTDIEEILEVLALQSKIKVVRELVNASWTKHIFIVKDYDDEMQVKEIQIDQSDKGFIWKMFSKQPCFFCPFTDRCNEEATDYFNPHHCPWLSDWINASIEGREYLINFDEIQEKLKDY